MRARSTATSDSDLNTFGPEADEITVAFSADAIPVSPSGRGRSVVTRIVRRCTGGDAVAAILGGVLLAAIAVESVANHLAGPPLVWMGTNLVLAVIPVVLATALGSLRRRGPMWLAGAALWLLLLPNTPYLLTDIIHAQANLAQARSARGSLAAIVVTYVALMTVGIVGYAYVLALMVADLRRQGRTRLTKPLLAATNAACAVGIWLGRVTRLNSWDAAHPRLVATALGRALQPVALIAIVVAFVVVGAGAVLLMRLAHTVACRVRPTWRRLGGPSLSAQAEQALPGRAGARRPRASDDANEHRFATTSGFRDGLHRPHGISRRGNARAVADMRQR